MSRSLIFRHIKSASIVLTICFSTILSSVPNKAQAQPTQNSQFESESDRQNKIKQLGDQGLPVGRRRGGTSRNTCPIVDRPLTALVPGKETTQNLYRSDSFLATTISEYPTFWVYIPQLPSNLDSGEFVLQNEAGDDVYRTSVALPSTSGAMGISLPSNSQYALKLEQKYQWYFKIYCDETVSDAEYFYVDAWIKKVPVTPELKTALDGDLEKIQAYLLYRDRHIWYDAINSLSKLLQANPQDRQLQAEWHSLIQSVGLSDVSDVSLVKLKQPK